MMEGDESVILLKIGRTWPALPIIGLLLRLTSQVTGRFRPKPEPEPSAQLVVVGMRHRRILATIAPHHVQDLPLTRQVGMVQQQGPLRVVQLVGVAVELRRNTKTG